MKNILGITVFLGLFLLIGCGYFFKLTTPSGEEEYFPHADGYKLTYRHLDSACTQEGTIKYSFGGTTTVGNISVQKMKTESFLANNASTSEALIKVSDSGVWIYGTTSSPTTEASLYLPFPLVEGNTWEVTGSGGLGYYKAMGEENVTVPLGTYTCMKVGLYLSGSPVSPLISFWYAKNVGLVKGFMYKLTSNYDITGTATLELTATEYGPASTTTTTTTTSTTTIIIPGSTTTTTTSTTTTTLPFAIETIETSSYVSGFPYLSIYTSGTNTYFSYAAALSQNLYAVKYAKWDGASWTKETIDSKSGSGYSDARPQIILNNSVPQIYYCVYPSATTVDGSTMVLKRATLEGTSWQIEDLMSSSRRARVKLDSSNLPHLLFPTVSGSGLVMSYSRWTGTSWETEEIPNSGIGVGGVYYYALDLDSNGNPHASFYTNDTQLLKYATKNSGSWSVGIIDASIDMTGSGYYNDLKVDSNHHPHVVYVNNINNKLIYAIHDGVEWNRRILGESMSNYYGNVPYSACSLQLDSNNKAHIAYGMGDTKASYNYMLKYAIINGITIEADTLIDNQAICIGNTDISLDSNSKPHIVYEYAKTIKYAYMK